MADKKTAATLQPSDFVHLHNHTHYSLLDGLTKVPALVWRVKELGMTAVAQTDHGTLSGAIEFYKAAKEESIKPIIGIEIYIAPRLLTDKDPAKDKNYYHLILLAMNDRGYQNLMRLSTIANLEGFYYKPRIDHIVLEKYNEGLIAVSGCIGGEVGDNLRQGQYEKAKEVAGWYKKLFEGRYYLELQDHGHPDHPSHWSEQQAVNDQLLQLSKELDIPAVVTADAHYLKREDQTAHEVLLCVQTSTFYGDEKRMSMSNLELHVTDPHEIIERWKDHPELVSNTRAIAERCNLDIELGKILIPQFPLPKGESEKTHLERLVYQGLAWRYGGLTEVASKKLTPAEAKHKLPPEILERAAYELGIIGQMGFNSYFLIISDFVNWGKNEGIVFGPGRGSAAGSIISYALKITELDPLAYDLLFERFLNPDRISMPDIDIDIQDSRRDEVIQYCVRKYGEDRVANIVTFGTMAARNAVRDVSRVLQVPYAEADRLAKMIPPPIQGRHTPLRKSLEENFDLKREYETNDSAKRVFDLAMQLEGTIRSHGVHAAGVVIAPDDIVKFVPLEMAQKGVVATQYPMGPVDELGLLKIDFLGLSNLTIIKNALRIIKRVYDQAIDVNNIPLDDTITFELLARGDTTGVFQLESAGMKRYLKELKPTAFDDIIAMVALYRPGPMQWIEDFIARKHGHRVIEYLHPKTEAALSNTYGVLVYQEQVMQIAKDLCGFSGGQADTLRKGVAKKKPEVLAALKKDFIDGALNNSDITKTKIDKFWQSLEAFAAYCFPKSHAACYGLIAYQTAYLKANYPAAFMAAVMTSDYDDIDRLAIEIAECQKMGVSVLAPDVSESFHEFAVVLDETGKAAIRFGLDAVKNVGSGAVEEILRARQIDGGFSDLEDFLAKTSVRVVNRKALESLIKAGALDRFGDRVQLLHNIDVLLAYATRLQRQASSGQVDLFGALDEAEAAKPKLQLDPPPGVQNPRDPLVWERELLGLYLSQHPLASFETYLSEQTVPLNSLKPGHEGKSVTVGGVIIDIREIMTKNGQKMAFVKLEDPHGELELVIFPSVYQESFGWLGRDRIIVAKGKVSAKGRGGELVDEVKILVDSSREVDEAQAQSYQPTGKKMKAPALGKAASPVPGQDSPTSTEEAAPQRVYIRLTSSEDQELLVALKQALDRHTGDKEVVLVIGPADSKQAVKLPGGIDATDEALTELRKLAGQDSVKVG